MTKNPPPEQFSTQIRSLFEKSDWPAARALLIAHLPDGWTGLYGLLAMTHMHVQPRSQADCDLALEWLEKGVLHDEPDSLAVLGRVLMSGELGKQNPERGIHLLQKAAQANVLMAVLTLLKIHEQGVENFLEPDLVLAAHCLRQAAELGDPACAYRLAVKLQQEGQDPVDVFRYYDKAAQGGMEQAMHNVGVCYLHGNGVPQNTRLAHAYFTQAARHASPLSIIGLAILHLDGGQAMHNRAAALGWVYVYQALYPQSETPEQLMGLLADASDAEQQQARLFAQSFLQNQLLKSPGGLFH